MLICSIYSSARKMEAVRTFEMSVYLCRINGGAYHKALIFMKLDTGQFGYSLSTHFQFCLCAFPNLLMLDRKSSAEHNFSSPQLNIFLLKHMHCARKPLSVVAALSPACLYDDGLCSLIAQKRKLSNATACTCEVMIFSELYLVTTLH